MEDQTEFPVQTPTLEALLGQKPSLGKRKDNPPKVVEGRARQRQERSKSSPSVEGDDTSVSSVEEAEAVSPAQSRSIDQSVKRATSGLIRLESRRRLRSVIRRLFYLCLVVAPLVIGWHYLGDEIKAHLNAYWEQILFKVLQGNSELPQR